MLTSISDGDAFLAEARNSTGKSKACCNLAAWAGSFTPVSPKVLRDGIEVCSAAAGACSKDDMPIDGAKPARNAASNSGHVLSVDDLTAASMVPLMPPTEDEKASK